MSKIVGFAAAMALFAGVSAFAQNSDSSSTPAAPPAASSDNSAAGSDTSGSTSDTATAGKHHHHHHAREARNSAATDNDADKLNSCQVSANPTPEQQQCLRQAENSRS